MAPPDNTLSSGTVFSKSQKKNQQVQWMAPPYQQQVLKLQPERSALLPARRQRATLHPSFLSYTQALKPKLLNMAFYLVWYLCFWKPRTANLEARITILRAELPTSPWEANDTSMLRSLTSLHNSLQWQFPQNNNKAKEKKLYKLKYHLTDRIVKLLHT